MTTVTFDYTGSTQSWTVPAGVTTITVDALGAQTTGSENGIYTAAAGAWSRRADADTDAEVTGGMAVPVVSGSNGGKAWMLITADPIVVGTTALTFQKLDAGTLVASSNLSDLTSVSTALTNLGISAFVQTLLDDVDAAAFRTTLGLGDSATKNVGTGSGTVMAGNDSRVAQRTLELLVTDPAGSAITTGDGKAYFTVPAALNGLNVLDVQAALTTVSSSGLPTIQLARVRSGTPADVLSTKTSIDASELTSYTATTPPVVDAANDDLATGDLLRVDIDVAGTGAKGLMVIVVMG